jgi:predicted DNA-binding protein (MmcQ/YjbR family)
MLFERSRRSPGGLPGAMEDTPFGPGALVFKVAGKVFAILEESAPGKVAQVTLKCEPALAFGVGRA